MSETQTATVRSVTDEEVDAFHEHGWVLLPGLLAPEVAAGLLARAQGWMGVDGDRRGGEFRFWQDVQNPSHDDELYHEVATSRELGRNSARLLGRDSSIRLLADLLAVKLPAGKTGQGSEATEFHQDGGTRPFDRNSLNWWIALDEVTPDQGSLQFYDGSHKLGALGLLISSAGDSLAGTDALGAYPRLLDCPLTEPLHLQPGDATAHTNLAVHGTRENASNRPRWSYIVSCFPGDALFTGLPSKRTEGMGLEPLQPLDRTEFPVIYAPDR